MMICPIMSRPVVRTYPLETLEEVLWVECQKEHCPWWVTGDIESLVPPHCSGGR